MKIKSRLLNKTIALLGSGAVSAWMSTLDYRVAYYDPAVDPAKREFNGRKLYVFWHEFILIPLFMRGHCNLAMLLSRHTDAEILSHVAGYMGFDIVRGSTRRGGASALRQLLAKSQKMNLAITPDGPRGPRRRLAAGPIYVASKLGMPLVCMGLGYDRPWRLPTWDRFGIPRPYSRVRSVVGPECHIPPDLERSGIERYRQHVESLLNRLTVESEAWAESGTYKIEEQPARREHPDPHWQRLRAAA